MLGFEPRESHASAHALIMMESRDTQGRESSGIVDNTNEMGDGGPGYRLGQLAGRCQHSLQKTRRDEQVCEKVV